MSLLCAMLKHLPDRSDVWDDGLNFRAPCRRCGTALIKDFDHGWRELDPEIDYSGRGKLRTRRRSTAESDPPRRRKGDDNA